MELDEIKQTWNDLNIRLEKAEMLNQKLVTDMLNEKQRTAKDKLMRYELKFMIFSLVFVFLMPLEYYAGIFNGKSTMLFEFVFVGSAAWQLYKMYLLKQMRIDTCTTTELLQKATQFKVVTRMHTFIGLFLMIPFFILLFLFEDKLSSAPMLIGVIVGGVTGLVIGLIFFFKNLKDIDSLIKSYKDIRDHEEK
jgi:hypothetical protein